MAAACCGLAIELVTPPSKLGATQNGAFVTLDASVREDADRNFAP